jgi:hypothetical protein
MVYLCLRLELMCSQLILYAAATPGGSYYERYCLHDTYCMPAYELAAYRASGCDNT